MADQPAPVDDIALAVTESSIDWLHGQPYAAWAAARGSECPVVGHASEFPGHETSYQILRYKHAETVLRDPETFS